MEVELKEIQADLSSLRQSLPDPFHHVLLAKLQAHVEHLDSLAKSAPIWHSKDKDISAEVVDSSPYSRPMTLQAKRS